MTTNFPGPRILAILTAVAPLASCSEASPPVAPAPSEVAVHAAAVHATNGPYLGYEPAYTELDDASAAGNDGSLRLTVDAGGDIPRFPDEFVNTVAVFGYGWVDGDTGNGVVAVIHPVIGRDSNQNPDGWHTHPVTLSAGAAFEFCIEAIGTSQGGISIRGDRLSLNMAARQAGLSADDLDVAAAFIVAADAGCTATGLGVDVLDTEGI